MRRWEKAEHSRVQPGAQCLSPHARRQGQGGKEGLLGQVASRWRGSGRAPVRAPTWPRAHTESAAREQTQQTPPQDCAGRPGSRLPKPGRSAGPPAPREKLVAEGQDGGGSLGRRPVSAVPPPWHALPHLHTVASFLAHTSPSGCLVQRNPTLPKISLTGGLGVAYRQDHPQNLRADSSTHAHVWTNQRQACHFRGPRTVDHTSAIVSPPSCRLQLCLSEVSGNIYWHL